MRAEYLFHLGRLCSVSPAASWCLSLADFANLTDSIDGWLKIEARMREVS